MPTEVKDPIELPPSVEHGTLAGFEAACRCLECVRAKNRAAMRMYRNSRIEPDAPPVSKQAEHGTRARYVRGCHCDPCKAANANYQRDYMSSVRMGLR